MKQDQNVITVYKIILCRISFWFDLIHSELQFVFVVKPLNFCGPPVLTHSSLFSQTLNWKLNYKRHKAVAVKHAVAEKHFSPHVLRTHTMGTKLIGKQHKIKTTSVRMPRQCVGISRELSIIHQPPTPTHTPFQRLQRNVGRNEPFHPFSRSSVYFGLRWGQLWFRKRLWPSCLHLLEIKLLWSFTCLSGLRNWNHFDLFLFVSLFETHSSLEGQKYGATSRGVNHLLNAKHQNIKQNRYRKRVQNDDGRLVWEKKTKTLSIQSSFNSSRWSLMCPWYKRLMHLKFKMIQEKKARKQWLLHKIFLYETEN